MTEYGGIAMQSRGSRKTWAAWPPWGYHDKVADEEAFLARYADLTQAILDIPTARATAIPNLPMLCRRSTACSPEREPKADVAHPRHQPQPGRDQRVKYGSLFVQAEDR